jgi:predicted ribosomally synthesized peptide with SipW-like signal peptide
MNTKILASLVLIGIAISGITMGTVAYFSDIEKSTGNTFTAGKIDLKVDLDRDGQHIWDLKNLVPATDKFFTYTDVKPGDDGEMTISLHVYDNPANLCFYITPNLDSDNGCNEPELKAETDCGAHITPRTVDDGELDDYLMYRIWKDDGITAGWQCPENGPHCAADLEEGDNIHQIREEFLTYCGDTNLPGPEWCLLNDINKAGEVWDLGDLTASETNYIGVQWDLPIATGNIAQSDSWGADVAFYVGQTRNNGAFTCPVTMPTE